MPSTPRHSPASERNKAPILEVLRKVLGPSGRMLEIASGTGQHAACFAASLSGWTWQPSDKAPTAQDLAALGNDLAFYSRAENGGDPLPNLKAPLPLDVLEPEWPQLPRFDAIFCANMLHIAPWDCCPGLMRVAARHLNDAGLLITYGPYFEDHVPPAPGNVAFDADLRSRNPTWGIRQVAEVAREADRAGLALRDRFEMPANNLTLVFARTGPAGSD